MCGEDILCKADDGKCGFLRNGSSVVNDCVREPRKVMEGME